MPNDPVFYELEHQSSLLYEGTWPRNWQEWRRRLGVFESTYFKSLPPEGKEALQRALQFSEHFLGLGPPPHAPLHFLRSHQKPRQDWGNFSQVKTRNWALFERYNIKEEGSEEEGSEEEVRPCMSILPIHSSYGCFFEENSSVMPEQGLVFHWAGWNPRSAKGQNMHAGGWEAFQKAWGSEIPLLKVLPLMGPLDQKNPHHQVDHSHENIFRMWAGRPDQGWLFEFDQLQSLYDSPHDVLNEITLRLISPGALAPLWKGDEERDQRRWQGWIQDMADLDGYERSGYFPKEVGALSDRIEALMNECPASVQERLLTWLTSKYLSKTLIPSEEGGGGGKKRL